MDSRWGIWVDTPHVEKAREFLDRIAQHMERQPTSIQIEPYSKTRGYRVAFTIGLEGASWNDCLVETLHLGQCIAFDWHLLGNVLDDASGVSHKARVSGVSMVEWQLCKTASDTTQGLGR